MAVTNYHYSVICLFLSCFLSPFLAACQNESALRDEATAKPIELTLQSVIQVVELTDRSSFVSVTELGDLEPNSVYHLDLKLHNPTSQDVVFDTLHPSCNCGRFLVFPNLIPASVNAQIGIEFKTPDFSKNGKFAFSAMLSKGREEIGTFSFRGSLNRNLYIDQQIVVSVGDKVDEYLIPILISDPIKASNLEIVKSDSLGEILAELEMRKEKPFLKLSIASSSFGGEFVVGNLKLKDRISGKSAVANMMITRRMPITISPRIARFLKQEQDEHKGGLAANLLMRVDKGLLAPDEKELDPIFTIEDSRVAAETQVLAKGFLKIKLILNDSQAKKLERNGKNHIECSVNVNGVSYTRSVMVY